MGLDENGNALIVADVSVGTWPYINMWGKVNALYGEKELDTACNIMFSTNMGTARNMKLEDIRRLIDYDGYVGFYYGENGNKVYLYEEKTIGDIEKELGIKLENRQTPDGTDIADYTLTGMEGSITDSPVVLSGYNYWLSTSSVVADFRTGSSTAYFGCMQVFPAESGEIYAGNQFSSAGNEAEGSGAPFRPVVALSDDVNVTYDAASNVLTLSI